MRLCFYANEGHMSKTMDSVYNTHPVLEITVRHRTLSDQILKMSGQFHIMIGHDDRTSHQHILSSLLQGVVSQ